MKHFLAILLFFTCLQSHAALNKWVDADGKVHYSDNPPVEVKVQTLRSAAEPEATTPASAPKTIAEREAERKKNQLSKEEDNKKAEQEKAVALAKQKNCESARSNLTVYENSPLIATYDAKGQRAFLDEAAHKKEIDEARKAVSKYCK